MEFNPQYANHTMAKADGKIFRPVGTVSIISLILLNLINLLVLGLLIIA
jgi:hypothetical protein